jgi:hypothetical protein
MLVLNRRAFDFWEGLQEVALLTKLYRLLEILKSVYLPSREVSPEF